MRRMSWGKSWSEAGSSPQVVLEGPGGGGQGRKMAEPAGDVGVPGYRPEGLEGQVSPDTCSIWGWMEGRWEKEKETGQVKGWLAVSQSHDPFHRRKCCRGPRSLTSMSSTSLTWSAQSWNWSNAASRCIMSWGWSASSRSPKRWVVAVAGPRPTRRWDRDSFQGPRSP